MGWLFSIVLFVYACINGNEAFLITSGLFAIAGAIGFFSDNISKAIKSVNEHKEK